MNERYYDIEVEGIAYHLPSVTTIRDIADNPDLDNWRADQGAEASDEYSRQTADIGNEIHKYVHRLSQGIAITTLEWGYMDEETKKWIPGLLSDEIRNGIKAYRRFEMETGLKVIHSEMVVYNLRRGYAGTLDCLGTIQDEDIVADWKTGGKFYPKLFYSQVAAYYHALPQRRGIKWLYVVNLNRNTGIPIVNKLSVKVCTPYWNYFKSCLSLFKDTKVIEALERR